MADRSDNDFENAGLPRAGLGMTLSELDSWFVREVLPLEAILMQFLRRNSRSTSDVADLCQDVYMRVYQAARVEQPERAKPFVLVFWSIASGTSRLSQSKP